MTRPLLPLTLIVLIGATTTSAQDRRPDANAMFSPSAIERAIRQADAGPRSGIESGQSSPRVGPRKDSVLNGGLIGAVVGGVGGSALIVAAHGGSDNIGRAMLNVSIGPAIGGFALGALIDALH